MGIASRSGFVPTAFRVQVGKDGVEDVSKHDILLTLIAVEGGSKKVCTQVEFRGE